MKTATREKGAALIVTVIVVAMLALVGVALMQSTSADRAASRSAANILRARLAAEAGAGMARAMVADLVGRYPDSVTVWQNIGGGGPDAANNEATVLYVRAKADDTSAGARPAQSDAEVTVLARPLISLQNEGALLAVAEVSSALPFGGTETVNLNAVSASQPRPFIGSRSAPIAGAPVAAAQWVYLGASPGPTNASNPATARFAFWMEDESFKVNVNVVDAGPRGANSPGITPEEARLDGAWGSSTLLRHADTAEVISARNRLPGEKFPSALTASIPGGVVDAEGADQLKFLTTVHSAGLDLSRGGFKRFNINTVTDGINDPTDAVNIRTSLDRVVAAIANDNSAPNFGQRFYRLSAAPADINDTDAVTDEHAEIYLQKIAANILDYVDGDDQPTYINNQNGFPIRTGPQDLSDATLFNEGIGGEGVSRVAAMGVEARPFLYGYAFGVQLTDMSPPGYSSANQPANNQAAFSMLVDHYFEFWNPGTRDLVVGAGNDPNVAYLDNIFLQVAGAPGWIDRQAGARFAAPGTKDFKVQLPNGAHFPAGEVTLVTTAPLGEANAFAPEAQNIISLSQTLDPAVRKVTGTTESVVTTNSDAFPDFDRFYTVSLDYDRCGDAQIDFDTQVLLGTSNGIVELFPALTLYSLRIWARSNNALFTNRSTLFGNLGAGKPNGPAPRSAEGDPRTLMEQLELQPYSPGGGANPNQTRLFQNDKTPLGTPNTDYVRPTEWVDYSSFAAGPANAPLFVRNGPLQSIGELGHITDPARVPGAGGALADVKHSRGGGRTLRVGQSELPRWYDGNQTSASRTWTSWRLADVFSTKNTLSTEGLINPNGVLRDGGAALQAVLHGLTYLDSPEGAPDLAGSPANIDEFVQSLRFSLTNIAAAGLPNGALNPFWERGEISELSVFNGRTFDRGREELVRRSIEMITTRGNIFTAYIIGQSLQGTNVTGTARMKQTFQIEPQFSGEEAFDDSFDPSDAAKIDSRFAAPSSYKTRVLTTSYD